MEETWKPIPNFQGYYASSLGRIKNEDGRILNQYEIAGYLGVCLTPYGSHLVHRLVCLAFHDNPDNKREVNHINGNKQDNRAENLEWVTHQENMQHAWKTGLCVMTEECRKKNSESNKGKIRSEETLRRMSESQKGKHHSEEAKKKMSESTKGELNPMYGKHHSEETRQKISKARKGHKGTTTGKIVITNEVVSFFILPEEFPEWESKGYRRGYKKNTNTSRVNEGKGL